MSIIGLVVEITVKDGEMDQFLQLIEADAVGSRKEPGCLRFGMLSINSTMRFCYWMACLLWLQYRSISTCSRFHPNIIILTSLLLLLLHFYFPFESTTTIKYYYYAFFRRCHGIER